MNTLRLLVTGMLIGASTLSHSALAHSIAMPLNRADFERQNLPLVDKPMSVSQPCQVITEITLDSAKLSGKFAHLTQVMSFRRPDNSTEPVFCPEIFIHPDERTYFLTEEPKNHCGIRKFNGSRYDQNGISTISIVDSRQKDPRCRALYPSPLVVTETRAGGSSETLYLELHRSRKIPFPVNPFPIGLED